MNLSAINMTKLNELDNYYLNNIDAILEFVKSEDNNGLIWEKLATTGVSSYSLTNIA